MVARLLFLLLALSFVDGVTRVVTAIAVAGVFLYFVFRFERRLT